MPKLLSYSIFLFVVSTFSCSEGPSNTPATETTSAPDERIDDRIKVLIIDGVNNHDWERTTAANKSTLEKTGRFDVDVSTSPRRGFSKEDWEAWRPRFSDYQVVVSNFNDDCEVDGGCETPWSAETQADFESFVREGGGFVPVHAADNAFTNWPAYNEMIAVGGWGGRQAGVSGSLLRKVDGEWMAASPDEGLSGEHGDMREFLVIHDQPSHPILEGLPTEWMHAEDELYSALRGPATNVEVLAHSVSKLTNEAEPMLMIITYGEGKIFHLPMGHFNDEYKPFGASVHCVGFQTVLARGTEYVATGEVTIGVPSSFPGKEEPVVVPPEDLDWGGGETSLGEKQVTADIKITDIPEELAPFEEGGFSKYVSVFGVHFFATPDARDEKLLHAARVMAEYLDNDSDGVPDNMLVLSHLVSRNAYIVFPRTEEELENMDYRVWRKAGFHAGQLLWDEETRPGFLKDGVVNREVQQDAALEEIWHLLCDAGWAVAYPDTFSPEPGSALGNCMDKARGGRFIGIPTGGPKAGYPEEAWYHYDDETCDYGCMAVEYMYWGTTSILGAQEFNYANRPASGEGPSREWGAYTPELMRTMDPCLYGLLTDPQYKIATKTPEGRYAPTATPTITVPLIAVDDR